MINESEEGEGETGGGGLPGEAPGDLLDQPGVIQVSPQDKEAIERVRASQPRPGIYISHLNHFS